MVRPSTAHARESVDEIGDASARSPITRISRVGSSTIRRTCDRTAAMSSPGYRRKFTTARARLASTFSFELPSRMVTAVVVRMPGLLEGGGQLPEDERFEQPPVGHHQTHSARHLR